MSERSLKEKKRTAPGLPVLLAMLTLAVLLSGPAAAGDFTDGLSGSLHDSPAVEGGKASIQSARESIISEDFDRAVSQYASLLPDDPDNTLLNAEYAYALALNGIYDAALARLDRAWTSGSTSGEVSFFASQVFALMGYGTLSADFARKNADGAVPSWIEPRASDLLQKYTASIRAASVPPDEDVEATFIRANRLTAQNYNLMSMALFQDIVNVYPDEYLPWVGYSIALEKAGMYERSAEAIQKAISLVGGETEQQQARTMLEQRLTSVQSSAGGAPKPATPAPVSDLAPDSKGRRRLAYAGGMISSSYISINGRFGTFISGTSNISADVGITSSSGSSSITLGISNYTRHKIFVAGYGLGASFGGGTSSFNLKISVGLSFLNDDRSGSWDIFLDGVQPLAPKGQATVVGMSIGRSVYFGSR